MTDPVVIELLTEIRDELKRMNSGGGKVREEMARRSKEAENLLSSVLNMLPDELKSKINRG